MKKFWLKALLTVIVILFVLTLVPSTIFAQNASMKIDVGRPGEVTTFYLSATGNHGQNWYFGIVKFEGSIEEFWKLTPEEQDKYLLETRDGTIDSDD